MTPKPPTILTEAELRETERCNYREENGQLVASMEQSRILALVASYRHLQGELRVARIAMVLHDCTDTKVYRREKECSLCDGISRIDRALGEK